VIKNKVVAEWGFESGPKILTAVLAHYLDGCGRRTFWQYFGISSVTFWVFCIVHSGKILE